MIHTNMPRKCTVFLLPRRLTRSAIYGGQIFYSHKWPTVLVRRVKGKPRNFAANLCGSLYSTFKTSFYPYAFYNKRLQTLFIDQLDWSKATCSFNIGRLLMMELNWTLSVLTKAPVSSLFPCRYKQLKAVQTSLCKPCCANLLSNKPSLQQTHLKGSEQTDKISVDSAVLLYNQSKNQAKFVS